MYNEEIKNIEKDIQELAEMVNNMLYGTNPYSLTKEETEDLIDRINALLKYSGKVSLENYKDIGIEVTYFNGLIKRIMDRLPSPTYSLCVLYVAMLYHMKDLRLLFDQFDDDQKIDLKSVIKDLSNLEVEDAIITKRQVVEYLKMREADLNE
jgi:ElaB/YqjD/DUF883 family membrane-anchored ribosome-binding protein